MKDNVRELLQRPFGSLSGAEVEELRALEKHEILAALEYALEQLHESRVAADLLRVTHAKIMVLGYDGLQDQIVYITAKKFKAWNDCDEARADLKEFRKQHDKTRTALAVLVKRLDVVRDSAEYRSVWDMAYVHDGAYSGPTFAAELEAARAVVEGT